MNCYVCKNNYDKELNGPISFNCGHSICWTCSLEDWIKVNKTCPTCRQTNKSQTTNHNLNELLKTVKVDQSPVNDSNSMLKQEIKNEMEEINQIVYLKKCLN